MNNARDSILNNLRRQQKSSQPCCIASEALTKSTLVDMIKALVENLESTHTEVHQLDRSQLLEWFNKTFSQLNVKRVLTGEGLFADLGLDVNLINANIDEYVEDIQTHKSVLFNDIEVGITTTIGAIASSGSLVVCPSEKEPRLLSLVPPIHIAIVLKEQVVNTFPQVIEHQQRHHHIHTTLVLISGPSKTADIEQVLAYGVHGPKKLITLIIT